MHGNALDANSTSPGRRGARPARPRTARARGAQVVLGDDVGRRAELARQLDRVAAAHLEPAGLVEAAAEGISGGERGGGHGRPLSGARPAHRRATAPPERGRRARRPRLRAVAARGPSRWGGLVDPARRRLVQGEPLRLRAAPLAPPGWPRSPSTCAATARARARSAPACSTTSRRWRRCCPARAAARCAARAWAATWRSWPPSALARRAVVAICPASERLLLRGLRAARFEFRADRADAGGVPAPSTTLEPPRSARTEAAGAPAARRGRRAGPRARTRARCAAPRAAARAAHRARRPPPLDPARPRAPGAWRCGGCGGRSPEDEPRAPSSDHRQRDQLRLRQPGDDRLVAADELDQEALEPRQHEVGREQRAGTPAVPVPPQPPGDEQHRQRLVHRRRMDRGGRRHRAVRVGHRPRAAPRDPVVAVARQLAADAPDRVAGGQRHRDDVEHRQGQPAPPARPGQHRRQRPRTRRRTRPGPCRRRGCPAGRAARQTSSRRPTTRARRRAHRPTRRRSSRGPSREACPARARGARRRSRRRRSPGPSSARSSAG